MGEDNDIGARLRRIEDRAEIADLVSTYALHAAAANNDGMADLFTEDGSFQTRAEPVVGREVLRAFFGRALTPGKTVPIVANLLIAIDGDEATVASLMATTWHDGKVGGFCGRYDDVVRREQGRWKFASRRYTFYHGMPAEG